MCNICFEDPILSRKAFGKWMTPIPPTTLKWHMAVHGCDEAGNHAASSHGKRRYADIRCQFEVQEHTNNQVFDTAGWRDRHIS